MDIITDYKRVVLNMSVHLDKTEDYCHAPVCFHFRSEATFVKEFHFFRYDIALRTPKEVSFF